eukprot:2172920-Rhodomonas_salina.1
MLSRLFDFAPLGTQVDKMHGLGVYRFVGGAKYRGEWKYGRMVPPPTPLLPSSYLDPAKYRGEWKYGRLVPPPTPLL